MPSNATCAATQWRANRKVASAGEDESAARWVKLETEVSRALKGMKGNSPDMFALKRCLYDIVFAHVYPRLVGLDTTLPPRYSAVKTPVDDTRECVDDTHVAS
jgi:hypothetical protein